RAHCDASVLASWATAQGTSVMAVATDADYQRDPTRWGSAEMAAHFPRFQHLDMRTSRAIIPLRHRGARPPPLLLPCHTGKPHLLVQGRWEAGPAIPCRSS